MNSEGTEDPRANRGTEKGTQALRCFSMNPSQPIREALQQLEAHSLLVSKLVLKQNLTALALRGQKFCPFALRVARNIPSDCP